MIAIKKILSILVAVAIMLTVSVPSLAATYNHDHSKGQATYNISCSACGKTAVINQNEYNYLNYLGIDADNIPRLYCPDCQMIAIDTYGDQYNLFAPCPNCGLSHILTYVPDNEDLTHFNNSFIDAIRHPDRYSAVKCCYCADKVIGNTVYLGDSDAGSLTIMHQDDTISIDSSFDEPDPEPEPTSELIPTPKPTPTPTPIPEIVKDHKRVTVYIYMTTPDLVDAVKPLIDIPANDSVDPYVDMRFSDLYDYLGAITSTLYPNIWINQDGVGHIDYTDVPITYDINYSAFDANLRYHVATAQYGDILPDNVYWYTQYYEGDYAWLDRPTATQRYVEYGSAGYYVDDIAYPYLTDDSLTQIAQAYGYTVANGDGFDWCNITYVIIEELPEPVTGSITGSIVYDNGDPLADTTIWIGDTETVTDSQGAFFVDGLLLGDYELYADLDGIKTKIKTIQATVYLNDNNTIVTDLDPTDKLNVALTPDNKDIKTEIVITPEQINPIPAIIGTLGVGIIFFIIIGRKKKKKKEEDPEVSQIVEVEQSDQSGGSEHPEQTKE